MYKKGNNSTSAVSILIIDFLTVHNECYWSSIQTSGLFFQNLVFLQTLWHGSQKEEKETVTKQEEKARKQDNWLRLTTHMHTHTQTHTHCPFQRMKAERGSGADNQAYSEANFI